MAGLAAGREQIREPAQGCGAYHEQLISKSSATCFVQEVAGWGSGTFVDVFAAALAARVFKTPLPTRPLLRKRSQESGSHSPALCLCMREKHTRAE